MAGATDETHKASKINRRPDSLERLLAHNAGRYATKPALHDPLNRALLEGRSDGFGGLSFTWQQTEITVARLASKFQQLGLETGDFVALQFPNFAEAPLLILALMRAKLVPCLVPLSWSQEEIERSFERLKPRALISCGQIEQVNYSEIMRELAFKHLHVRFVLGAGYDIAEGITDLNSLFENDRSDEVDMEEETDRTEDMPVDLAGLAIVNYIDPITPVPHSYGQILASGLLKTLEFGLSSEDHMLCGYPLSSTTGLAAHFYPWLVSGAQISLHHPFDFGVLKQQLVAGEISYLSIPNQVVQWIIKNKLVRDAKLGMVWSPGHLPTQSFHAPDGIELFDIWNLGGLGLAVMKRPGGQPEGLFRDGRICLPSSEDKELCLAAGTVINGTLHIKGRIFPSLLDNGTSLEWFSLKKKNHEGWLDTGLEAHLDHKASILIGNLVATQTA